jgi:ribosomal protein S18 acetylase RimI-like enzyme
VNQTQVGPPVVRRAGEPDTDELARMLMGLTDLSLYFRFQTAIGRPPRETVLLRMLRPTGAAFVATRRRSAERDPTDEADSTGGFGRGPNGIDGGTSGIGGIGRGSGGIGFREVIVGHVMWAWAPGEATAELAAVISEPEQRRGLGIRMLSTAAGDAIAAGAEWFLFVVGATNDPSIRMVRRRWPEATVERDGTVLNFVVPARLPDQPEERADVVDEQVRGLEGGEVPAPVELRPVDDVVPAL